jgi:hypothetical protein
MRSTQALSLLAIMATALPTATASPFNFRRGHNATLEFYNELPKSQKNLQTALNKLSAAYYAIPHGSGAFDDDTFNTLDTLTTQFDAAVSTALLFVKELEQISGAPYTF